MPAGRWRIEALKALDQTFGRLAATVLAARRRAASGGAPVDPAGVRRLLVIRPGGLGDAVLLVPLLHALRSAFAGAAIDLLMERRNAGLVDPALADRVLLYDRRPPRELWEAIRGRYDVVVDTEQWYHFSAVVAFLTRAPVRCGFATNRRARLFTHPVAYDERAHEPRVFLTLLEALIGRSVPFDEARPFLAVPPAAAAWAAEALAPLAGRALAVLAPAAPIAERQWAPERWVAVARGLVARGRGVVLVGAPDDRALCRAVAAGLDGCALDLSGRTTIAQTAAVIARAALYVASDGGLLHVAYGLGVPTVGLYGAAPAEKWAPRGARARTVHVPLPCSPCARWGHVPACPRDVECLRRISVEMVLGAVDEAERG
jgi:lipopolysaccharide heptosyltransferase II